MWKENVFSLTSLLRLTFLLLGGIVLLASAVVASLDRSRRDRKSSLGQFE